MRGLLAVGSATAHRVPVARHILRLAIFPVELVSEALAQLHRPSGGRKLT